MPLPLIYHEDYSPPFTDGHRFPMAKFRLLKELLLASGMTREEHLLRPASCPSSLLALAHCPAYIERFISGSLRPDEQRRLGLPWSEALVRRTLRAVGGSLLTAEQALQRGMACHLAGGTHHAHYDFPSGFCVFNDVAVVSRHLLHSGKAGQILIVDCDVHQGDGTARLLADTPQAFTLSLHCAENFPARKASSDWDIALPRGLGDQQYLDVLSDALDVLLPRLNPDLVLYIAGVDVHRDDVLGHLGLSDDGIAARDHLVLSRCLERDIPVAGLLGGGYDPDPARVAARHALLPLTAATLWQED